MKKLLFVLMVGCAGTATATASDIAFYVGAPNTDGWYTAAGETKARHQPF